MSVSQHGQLISLWFSLSICLSVSMVSWSVSCSVCLYVCQSAWSVDRSLVQSLYMTVSQHGQMIGLLFSLSICLSVGMVSWPVSFSVWLYVCQSAWSVDRSPVQSVYMSVSQHGQLIGFWFSLFICLSVSMVRWSVSCSVCLYVCQSAWSVDRSLVQSGYMSVSQHG